MPVRRTHNITTAMLVRITAGELTGLKERWCSLGRASRWEKAPGILQLTKISSEAPAYAQLTEITTAPSGYHKFCFTAAHSLSASAEPYTASGPEQDPRPTKAYPNPGHNP